MKIIYSIFFIVCAGLFSIPARADLQPACFPDTPEARNWPVGVIYLHGLYPWPGHESTNPNGPSAENANREQLRRLAQQLTAMRIRIALPVAPRRSVSDRFGTNRAWSRTGLDVVEREARSACGGAELAGPRAMIGFSNGGYQVASLAGNCEQMANYSRLVAIGAPGSQQTNSCGTLINQTPHVFPGASRLRDLLGEFRGTTSPPTPSPLLRTRPIPPQNHPGSDQLIEL